MGAIGGELGLSGGQSGTGIAGPSAANPQGLNNLQNSYGQLESVASGTSISPAQAQYIQSVQNLAKQQAGAISSVQGISPALAARMNSQQGSAAMQNAAAQGAANQAQEQLGAMGTAAQVAANQAQNYTAMQSNINNVNGQLANTQIQGQQAMIGGIMNGASSMMGSMADGGEVGPVVSVDNPTNTNAITAPAAPAKGPQSAFGKFLKGASQQPDQSQQQPTTSLGELKQGMSNFTKAVGGQFKSKGAAPDDGQSAVGDYTPGGSAVYASPNFGASIMNMPNGDASATSQNAANYLMSAPTAMAKGGKVPAMVSPGELWLPPSKVDQVAKGKNPMEVGERIPGKPKVPGNSYANDVVPKDLDVGGVVIPNNIMQSKDPAKGASDFVAKIIAKRKAKK